MAAGWRKQIPAKSLLQLRQRLDRLPHKSPERAGQVRAMSELYGISTTSVNRALKDFLKPRVVHRTDHGKPRVQPKSELERYCELVAALKLRTTNKQGRHLCTKRAIELLEEYGVETAQGLVRAPKAVLTRSTVNQYLTLWRLDQPRLRRQPPAVRFQAEHSNDCWQFDMSPSDLKRIDKPDWIKPVKGEPTLMLYSVVDDRSGVPYQEYRCVSGEDAESALRFLFNAMAPKVDPEDPFQGRPLMIYLDNGPVAKNRVFQNVMHALGIEWMTHIPAAKDGERVTARPRGKVERPFRTVKEAHETLYHFHKPETERWHPGDVRVGAILPLRPRAGTAPSGRGRTRVSRGHQLRSRAGHGWRIRDAAVGAVRQRTLRRVRRRAHRTILSGGRAEPVQPLPRLQARPGRRARRPYPHPG